MVMAALQMLHFAVIIHYSFFTRNNYLVLYYINGVLIVWESFKNLRKEQKSTKGILPLEAYKGCGGCVHKLYYASKSKICRDMMGTYCMAAI